MAAKAVKKRSGGWVWTAGLLGLAGLCGFAVVHTLPMVERDIRTDVNKTLADKGLAAVDAQVSGQTVTLKLKAPGIGTDAQLAQARVAVAQMKTTDLTLAKLPPVLKTVADSQWLKGGVTEIHVVHPTLKTAPSKAMVQGQAIMEGETAASASPQAVAVTTRNAPSEVFHGTHSTTIAQTSELPRVAGDAAFEASTIAAQSCEDRVNHTVGGRRITYEYGTYTLTAEAQGLVDDVYRVMSTCPSGTRLTVSGYTDNVGDGTVNQVISQARAQATADALVARGLASTRILVRGYGATAPVADNSTSEGREKNRRIVFAVNVG